MSSGRYQPRRDLLPAVEAPLWAALRAAAQAGAAPASVVDLHIATGAEPNAVQHRLARWVRAGFVTRLEGRPKRFAMNDTAPDSPKPPRVDRAGRVSPRERTARQRLWSGMRVLRAFDVPTLIISQGVSRRAAEDYVNCLQRSGHLAQLSRGNSRTGTWSRYRLARDTGPAAPSVVHAARPGGGRSREVVDRNTGERIDVSPGVVSLRSGSAPADDRGEG